MLAYGRDGVGLKEKVGGFPFICPEDHIIEFETHHGTFRVLYGPCGLETDYPIGREDDGSEAILGRRLTPRTTR